MLSGFGLGCLLQLFLIVFRDFRHQLVGRVFLLILLASVAFLVDPLVPQPWHWLTSDLQTAMPALFWLMCQLVFAPRPRLKSVWGVMALYSFLAPALSRSVVEAGELSELGLFVCWELAQYFEYIVVLHGLSYVVTHWQDDLVETRRKARLIFLLVVGGSVGIATVSLNFGIYHELIRGVITSIAASVTLICMVRAREGILELAPDDGGEADAPPQMPALASDALGGDEVAENEPDDVVRLLDALMQAGFYKTEKLTLKKLSVEIGVPEYRLRKVINQKLGYRNFNDYINQLRIAEAARRLVDDADVPILNVSLDVGYRSLSSFNRAFRDILDTTPTEFRQRSFSPEKPVQKL
ncbi:MAG: AraC family transcriptional regulator [Alteromonadaceae bacterium]|nr:AraC family transcriptional regulator [Alteromonadaceae bacterium]MBH86269.1 AraC family transcriptional regulator [Alteromonadaceae bacterium]|tara:strand:- start:10490 stop:11548 length:1059 start_codon:yes stop_codon:yes gene_type:complete